MAQPNHHTNPVIRNEENIEPEETEKSGPVSDVESSEDVDIDDEDTVEQTVLVTPKRA